MPEFIQIEIEKADRQDFIFDGSVQFGMIFYLKSQESSVFHGPYLLKDETERLKNFKQWLEADMVYIQTRRI